MFERIQGINVKHCQELKFRILCYYLNVTFLVCRTGDNNLVADRLVPGANAETLAQRDLPRRFLLCLLPHADHTRRSGAFHTFNTAKIPVSL